MSKEEFLKIQTCVLKVHIHCDGCKQKVKKILQKIEGVYKTNIDSEQGKVTVSGSVDPATLIKKLIKNGKHAELWGAPKGIHNQFKNLQIESAKNGGNNKGQGGQKGPPKGGQNPQMKGQLAPPQFVKGPKMAAGAGPVGKDPKAAKFGLRDEDGLSDDDFDDDGESDYDDDEFDDDLDDVPVGKMMGGSGSGRGGPPMANVMMQDVMKGGGNGGGGGNGKKAGGGGGGGGNGPSHGGGGNGKGVANGGNKNGNGNGNVNGNNIGGNQNQGGSGGKGGKNGGGGGGGNFGGGQIKNGNNANGFSGNVAKKGGDGPHGMMMPTNMMAMNGAGGGPGLGPGPMPSMPMGHASNPSMCGPMGNLPAVQGLPASGPGAGQMPGNPYYQQQLAAMMMNQQHANGNERFQPMMYARPPAAVNYMPPYYSSYSPYPSYPPPGERADQYTMFSDENASGCIVM